MRKTIFFSLTLLGTSILYGCSSAQFASISEAFDCADPYSIDCTVSRQRASEERRKADQYKRAQERYNREHAEYLDCVNAKEVARRLEVQAQADLRWRLEQRYLEDGILDESEKESLEEDIRATLAFEARQKQRARDLGLIPELEEDPNCYEPSRPIEPYWSYY